MKHQTLEKIGKHFGKKDINVVFAGSTAMTDGSKITLPALPEGVDIDDQLVSKIRGSLQQTEV